MDRDTMQVKRCYTLEQVFTKNVLNLVLKECLKDNSICEVIDSEVRPASDGITGFLGDHIKAVLHVKVGEDIRRIPIFVKRIPVENKPKAEFIDQNNFYKREKLMFQLLKEMKGADGPNPWCAESYLYSDTMIVMPDLTAQGYTVLPLLQTLDLTHVLFAISTLARFHAAFVNYETNKSFNRPNSFYKEHGHILQEPTFQASPWLRTSAKLSADLLDAFSTKFNKTTVLDLEEKLYESYVIACNSLTVEDGTLNVVVHKDLWINNILFKYNDGIPTNCLLIDYQCIRYGPPTFDITSFLYLNTTRSFREVNEATVYSHYYKIFSENLSDRSKKRLELLGYDEKEFLGWCEKSRMFGAFEAIGIFPLVLMDPETAQKIFDDPETYLTLVEKDRSGPVMEYARNSTIYRERQLEVTEEFVERYLYAEAIRK